MANRPADIPVISEGNLAGPAGEHQPAHRTEYGGRIAPTVDKDDGLVAGLHTLPQFIQELG